MNIYLQNCDIVQYNMVAVSKGGIWIASEDTIYMSPNGTYTPASRDIVESAYNISLDNLEMFTKLSDEDFIDFLEKKYPIGSIVVDFEERACRIKGDYYFDEHGVYAEALYIDNGDTTDISLYKEDWAVKLDKPLLVTEDGKECYGGEVCYCLLTSSGWRIDEITVKSKKIHDPRIGKSVLVFQSSDNASHYKYMNQPRYAIQDLVDALHNGLIALDAGMSDKEVSVLETAIIDQLDKNE